jgi:hypothetical protein
MIKADIKGLEQYLDDYIKEFEIKAEEAVRDFAYDTVVGLVRITPYGDSVFFRDYYLNRQAPLPKAEGMTRANWKVSLKGSPENISYVPNSRKGETSLSSVSFSMDAYKLGDKFSFYNATPYVPFINSTQAPEGLYLKAENALITIYRNSNLNEYIYK